MHNLLSTPQPRSADIRVVGADWVEVNCQFKADRSISKVDFANALKRASEIRDETAEIIAGDVFLELEDRIKVCHRWDKGTASYPFKLNSEKTALTLRRGIRRQTRAGLLYWFLLLICRVNMDSRTRVLDSQDPTKLFELVCADVLKSFWRSGDAYSGAMVFGTGGRSPESYTGFENAINRLSKLLSEGSGWRPGARTPGAGDAKLDVVAWRKFSDLRPGSLVGFAQCKTGIHWKDHLDKLQPAKFSLDYFREPLLVEPIRLYMIPWRIDKQHWRTHTNHGGILFDRCRIVQYGDYISSSVIARCRKWVMAALEQQATNAG